MKKILLQVIISALILPSFAQQPGKDKAVFKTKEKGFYQNVVLKDIQEYNASKEKRKPQKYFTVDFSGRTFPTNPDIYTTQWHNRPISQGRTGTCWSFSSTSFIESEVYRQTGLKVKLSEMFTVYYEYVERAKYFVEHRGNMNFGEGSEVNATPKIIKLYGAVPEYAFTGKLKGQKAFDHKAMVTEMTGYLEKVKENNLWDEEEVVDNIKSIMNHYMGTPPGTFKYNGKDMTPEEFAKNVLKTVPGDYYSFMSTEAVRYGERGELEVTDNWWHSTDYYNIDPDDFVSVFKNALKKGFTVAFCGDVSEPGYSRYAEVGIIPSFDIPAEYIDADAREMRFRNGSTSDDHCMHVVGYLETDDGWWFLIKDSSSGGFDGEHKGYIFLSEDYIKLKILAVMVHKDGAREILDKIIK